MTKTKLKFKFDNILCKSCKHFEDTGLHDFIQYSKQGHVTGRVQVRFYCYGYKEYLTKLYSRCVSYIS
jgi:hypothetical protein